MSEKVLNEILEQLNNLNKVQQEVKVDMAGIKQAQQDIESQMNSRFDALEVKVAQVQEDTTEIKAGVNRIEKNEPKDIHAMLDQINHKLNDKDSDVFALHKRLFRVESTLERITNQ